MGVEALATRLDELAAGHAFAGVVLVARAGEGVCPRRARACDPSRDRAVISVGRPMRRRGDAVALEWPGTAWTGAAWEDGS